MVSRLLSHLFSKLVGQDSSRAAPAWLHLVQPDVQQVHRKMCRSQVHSYAATITSIVAHTAEDRNTIMRLPSRWVQQGMATAQPPGHTPHMYLQHWWQLSSDLGLIKAHCPLQHWWQLPCSHCTHIQPPEQQHMAICLVMSRSPEQGIECSATPTAALCLWGLTRLGGVAGAAASLDRG